MLILGTRLCVCATLKHYLERTAGLRLGFSWFNDSLLLSYIKLHRPVTKDSISRWIKTLLSRSGVDTSKFKAGSVRSAAVSKSKAMDLPIACIMSNTGWTRESTFAKFYDKPILTAVSSFQEAVLG